MAAVIESPTNLTDTTAAARVQCDQGQGCEDVRNGMSEMGCQKWDVRNESDTWELGIFSQTLFFNC
jgi:hypothetical protein